jgi:GST-like protein
VNIGKATSSTRRFSGSPSNRIPAIVDHAPAGTASHQRVRVGRDLLYLAGKTGQFIPQTFAAATRRSSG